MPSPVDFRLFSHHLGSLQSLVLTYFSVKGVCSQDDPEKSCSTQEQHNKYKSVEELQTMVIDSCRHLTYSLTLDHSLRSPNTATK